VSTNDQTSSRSRYRRRRSRPKYIRKAVRSRGITGLYHFTRLANLESILTHGLLSPSTLAASGVDHIATDGERHDHHPNANCLSISFPNNKMFFSKRQEQEPKWGWCVLEVDPSVLWLLPSAFYPYNAADRRVSSMDLRGRMHVAAFHELFSDFDQFQDQPREPTLRDQYPTNVQAEALVFGDIKPQYIQRVFVPTMDVLERLNNVTRFAGTQFVLAPLDESGNAVGYHVFSPREWYPGTYRRLHG
jgi:hypothetical protein